MDLSLEIIPVEQITVGDQGHTILPFKKEKSQKHSLESVFGLVEPLKVTPSKEDNRHQYV